MNGDLSAFVAHSADVADLHAPVPTLLLELQTLLGTLASTVARETNRGRKPFRPGPDWPGRLGELGYGVFLLADQTGVDLIAAVAGTANGIAAQSQQQQRAPQNDWPLPE